MGKSRAIVMAFGILLGILSLCGIVLGMATEHIGPDSATVAQPGWPKGIEELLRHRSRVYSIWCNGNENFYFKATPGEINELLALFSKARLRDHEVRIEPGKPSVKSFNNRGFEYNVSLPILSGIALWVTRDGNNADTLEPRLTIHPGDDGVLLKQLKLPENVIVSDAVGNCGLQGKRAMPERKAWFGRVQFEDASPAADFEHGISVYITFWEKDYKDGIRLAGVDREGFFKVILSDQEIAGLEKDNPWLTMTVGNWETEPKKEDARFPVQMLTREKEKALPLKIFRPKYYYGRILFEDGSPPVLDPKPWPGAEINVLFDYAGWAKLDAEGYFQIFLEPEQFEELKAEKARKNIYCPTERQGGSTARYAFPAELLSQDKAKAGVVKIEKPVYEEKALAAASSLAEKGKFKEAADGYRAFAEKYPDHALTPQALLAAASIYEKNLNDKASAEQMNKALVALREKSAAKEAAKDLLELYKLASSYATAGEDQKAIDTYRKFVASGYKDAKMCVLAQFRAAGLLEKLGKTKEAAEAYRAVEAIKCDDAYAAQLKEKAEQKAAALEGK